MVLGSMDRTYMSTEEHSSTVFHKCILGNICTGMLCSTEERYGSMFLGSIVEHNGNVLLGTALEHNGSIFGMNTEELVHSDIHNIHMACMYSNMCIRYRMIFPMIVGMNRHKQRRQLY
jgi:hypothetical protein